MISSEPGESCRQLFITIIKASDYIRFLTGTGSRKERRNGHRQLIIMRTCSDLPSPRINVWGVREALGYLPSLPYARNTILFAESAIYYLDKEDYAASFSSHAP